MAEKIEVGMDLNYKYIIVRQDPHTGDMMFFKGFFNETECVGTENECQCWENESWVDNEGDAFRFGDFSEAKASLDNLGDKTNCTITMYGLGQIENMGGSKWYPLKSFKA